MVKHIPFILFYLALCGTATQAQSFSRVRADFTVKVKEAGGSQSLTMGEICYDRNVRQIIYHVRFPEQETWITADTVMYRMAKGRLVSRTAIPSIAEFTVFHLALSSQLRSFGLEKTLYKPDQVTREGDQVITTWIPPSAAKKKFGKIMVATRGNQLSGVIFFDPEGQILRKQFFEEFQLISGVSFPGRIVEINYVGGKELYQITTFKKIRIDERENDSDYAYPVSSLR